MSLDNTLREIAPSKKQVLRIAENAVIRKAIWSLPKPVIWVLVAIIVVLSVLYGGK